MYRLIFLSDKADTYTIIDEEDYSWVSKHLYNKTWHNRIPWKLYAKRNTGLYRDVVYLHREILTKSSFATSSSPLGIASNHNIKYYVDHINGQSLDNRKVNLRWVTPIENNKNKYRKGTAPTVEEIIKELDKESCWEIPF